MEEFEPIIENQAAAISWQEAAAAMSQLDFEIALYDGILERDPNYVDVLRVLGNNLSARADFVRGLEIDRRLVALCPNDRFAQYKLACTYAALGMLDAGLSALARAIECGYEDFDYMLEDQDLAALRSDPRFDTLVQARRR